MPIAVALLGAGAWLIYAAVTGQPIGASIAAAFTGQAKPAPVPLSTDVPSGTAGAAGTGGNTPTVSSTSAGPPALVSIGQGSHRLRADAAAGFQAWQRRYGAPIPISDSYRDWAVQAAQHAKDPGRFVAPENSAHPQGLAVDVDMARVNQPRLIDAAKATGWCQSAVNKSRPEPWHFSYGVCQ